MGRSLFEQLVYSGSFACSLVRDDEAVLPVLHDHLSLGVEFKDNCPDFVF